MTTKKEFWSGFQVFADMLKIEALFIQLTPEFKKLETKKKKYYFNYYENRCRIGLLSKNTKQSFKRIKNLLINRQLNFREYHNNKNEADFDSGNDSDANDIQRQIGDIEYKYLGSKHALQIINELTINSQNFDTKKEDVAGKISNHPEKAEILKKYIYFHSIVNPICFFKKRNRINSSKYSQMNGGEIYDIEEEILDLIIP